MVLLRSIIVFIAAILFVQLSYAQHKKLEEPEVWVQKINEHTQSIKSLQANFKQQKVLSFLEEPVISTGKFWFQEPNLVRWEYTSPYQYIMIMNGGVLTVKDGTDEHTTDLSSNKMFEQMTSLISGSIQGTLLKDDLNYIKEYFQTANQVIIRFIPKDNQLLDYIDYMEIGFSKKTSEVEIMLMHEPSGDYTKMIFSQTTINQTILENVFQ